MSIALACIYVKIMAHIIVSYLTQHLNKKKKSMNCRLVFVINSFGQPIVSHFLELFHRQPQNNEHLTFMHSIPNQHK